MLLSSRYIHLKHNCFRISKSIVLRYTEERERESYQQEEFEGEQVKSKSIFSKWVDKCAFIRSLLV